MLLWISAAEAGSNLISIKQDQTERPTSSQSKARRADRRGATAALMLLACCLVTGGDLLLSQAMRELGPLGLEGGKEWWEGRLSTTEMLAGLPAEVYALTKLVFSIPKVWLAISLLLLFLVLWLVALSWSDLTLVMPLTSLTYILNALAVGPVLGEQVSPRRWMGTLLIAIGVAVITLERPDKPETL